MTGVGATGPLMRVRRAAAALAARIRAPPTLASALLLALVLFVLIAAGFHHLREEIVESVGIGALDRSVLAEAIRLRTPFLIGAAGALAVVFGPVCMPILTALAALALGLRRRRWTPALLIVVTGAGSLLMTVAGKDLTDRARPPRADAVPPFESSPSFPSGHTLNATAICGIVAVLLAIGCATVLPRVLVLAGAALTAIAVGLSRLLLGAHWFTDVLAGWYLGAAWAGTVVLIAAVVRRGDRRRRAAAALDSPTSGAGR